MIDIHDLCDQALAGIEAGRWVDAYMTLFPGLRHVRARADGPGWSAAVAQARAHALGERLRNEPLTRRAADKPRGYPGDAVLLDMLYFDEGPRFEAARGVGPDDSTRKGFLFPSAASAAVRHRRTVLAHGVDAALARKPDAAILSVACGHLREFELTTLAASPIRTNPVGGGVR
jgi:hypothetical protein